MIESPYYNPPLPPVPDMAARLAFRHLTIQRDMIDTFLREVLKKFVPDQILAAYIETYTAVPNLSLALEVDRKSGLDCRTIKVLLKETVVGKLRIDTEFSVDPATGEMNYRSFIKERLIF